MLPPCAIWAHGICLYLPSAAYPDRNAYSNVGAFRKACLHSWQQGLPAHNTIKLLAGRECAELTFSLGHAPHS